MNNLERNNTKGKNQIIFLDYLSSRYIKVKSDRYIQNLDIKNSLESIGSGSRYSELGLKGSPLHKGIKKIRHYCKELHSVTLTGREIKYLINTRKKIYNSDNVICCTYSVYIILKSIVEILEETDLNRYYEYLPLYFERINGFKIALEKKEIETNRVNRNLERVGEIISQLEQNIN